MVVLTKTRGAKEANKPNKPAAGPKESDKPEKPAATTAAQSDATEKKKKPRRRRALKNKAAARRSPRLMARGGMAPQNRSSFIMQDWEQRVAEGPKKDTIQKTIKKWSPRKSPRYAKSPKSPAPMMTPKTPRTPRMLEEDCDEMEAADGSVVVDFEVEAFYDEYQKELEAKLLKTELERTADFSREKLVAELVDVKLKCQKLQKELAESRA